MSDAAISLYGVRHKETAKILTRTLRIEMERDRERKEDRRERKTVIFLFFFLCSNAHFSHRRIREIGSSVECNEEYSSVDIYL